MKKQRQKKQRQKWDFSGAAVAVFALALVVTMGAMAWTMSAINYATVSKEPTAILASAGVSEGTVVSLPVMYYDQNMDNCVNLYDLGTQETLYNRQFEWSECGYYYKGIERGMVEYELDEEHLPVAVGGKLTSNRGVKGDNFKRWYHEVEGVSESRAGILKINYTTEGAKFSFYKREFYPLDGVGASDKDGHNHLFTMNFAVPFRVLMSGDESFAVTADDDTWVYVDDKLVVDMGGVHDATTGEFVIHEDGEIYAGVNGEELAFTGVVLDKDADTVIRIFHADRNADESTFDVVMSGMSLTVTNTEIAGKDSEVQVAYDPNDPTYVAPLGESTVFQPDNSRGLMIVATVLGVLVVLLAVFMMASVRGAIRRSTRK